ncbi:hypothetical protein AURDEDRAFT_188609 [Auricularia subglabra TFB-10046 SS5]|nr:hypothetical protein AURDEDRAFT_188609 [Auricularia subglabra TFB-10046 SS5]
MSPIAGMLLSLATFLSVASPRLFNVTIDDTFGDERTEQNPQYGPDNWIPRGLGTVPCSDCRVQPDSAQAYRGSWHDRSVLAGQDPSTVSMNFSGTRICVFFILFNVIDWEMDTRLRFYVDGSNPADPPYLYNQLVFDSKDLEPGNHTLQVSTYSKGDIGSTALFDYAIYTTQTDDDLTLNSTQTTQSVVPTAAQSGDGGHSVPLAAAIGGAIAGAFSLALLLAVGCWIRVYQRQRRFRRRQVLSLASVPEPYLQASSVEPSTVLLPSQKDVTNRRDGEKGEKAALVLHGSPVGSIDDFARLRSELGWAREELERSRTQRTDKPPEYPHASRDSFDS